MEWNSKFNGMESETKQANRQLNRWPKSNFVCKLKRVEGAKGREWDRGEVRVGGR